MKLIELTGFGDTGTEYLNPNLIARIESYTQEKARWETVERKQKILFGLFTRTIDDKLFKGTEVSNGSIVYLSDSNKGSSRTYVKETPTEILEKIKNKQFVVEL